MQGEARGFVVQGVMRVGYGDGRLSPPHYGGVAARNFIKCFGAFDSYQELSTS